MMKVRYGPFQPDLEDAFMERLLELRSRDPWARLAVVAPSRRAADRLERLTAVERRVPLLGV
ncbi:MAG: hypothetical protein HY551_00380, partial [Elusimicrobia bacterium]|nr:hypothetical protein [Elusimicrobiota bacterium]